MDAYHIYRTFEQPLQKILQICQQERIGCFSFHTNIQITLLCLLISRNRTKNTQGLDSKILRNFRTILSYYRYVVLNCSHIASNLHKAKVSNILDTAKLFRHFFIL